MFRQVAGSSPSAPAPAPVLCPLDPLPISLSSYLSLYSHPDIHSSLKRNVQDCWTTIFMYAFPIYRDSSGLEIPNLTSGGTFTQRKEGIFTCTYLQGIPTRNWTWTCYSLAGHTLFDRILSSVHGATYYGLLEERKGRWLLHIMLMLGTSSNSEKMIASQS